MLSNSHSSPKRTRNPTSRRLWIIGLIAYLLVAGNLRAAEETHECYYHSYYYNTTFGDLLNIYGCVYGDLSRYLNIYNVQGLIGGVQVRVVVTPFYANSGQLLDDVQIVWYPIAGGAALAFSQIVTTSTASPSPMTFTWTPPVGGQYELVVSTTAHQNWNANDGSFGPYNILISQITAATPTPGAPTPVRGRETPTPGPPLGTETPTPVRGRETATPGPPPPTATPTPTPTPTPDPDTHRPRIIPFR